MINRETIDFFLNKEVESLETKKKQNKKNHISINVFKLSNLTQNGKKIKKERKKKRVKRSLEKINKILKKKKHASIL